MKNVVFLLFLFLIPFHLSAQEETLGLRPELGFWIGASNPMPQTDIDQVLNDNIGTGFFFRISWPWIFQTEFGTSYSHYLSRTTQSLTVIPMYGALVYRLPLPFQLNFFIKLGGGAAYLEVRPANKSGWDPLYWAGFEASIQAGRKVRIGLRIDFNQVNESHLDPPPETEWIKYVRLLNRDSNQDIRYQSTDEYKLRNAQFFHFGLMISFYL